MIINIGGGSDGIAEYLRDGRKSNRDLHRDIIDDRIVLSGDLDVCEMIYQRLPAETERYHHFSLSFFEDHIPEETLRAIDAEFCAFLRAAYREDELYIYSEAHVPKVKVEVDYATGELKDRKVHIHAILPTVNLLSGQRAYPLGLIKAESKIAAIDAFQEHINRKYGLASPKDEAHRRGDRAIGKEAEIVAGRKLGEDAPQFTQQREEKTRIFKMAQALREQGKGVMDLKAALQREGEVKIRNAGKPTAYLWFRANGSDTGINLREDCFRAARFGVGAAPSPTTYQDARRPRPFAPERIDPTLERWRRVGALETRYVRHYSGQRLREWNKLDDDAKLVRLQQYATKFNQQHPAPGLPALTFTGDKHVAASIPAFEQLASFGASPPPDRRGRLLDLSNVALVVASDGRTDVLLPGDVYGELDKQQADDGGRAVRRASTGGGEGLAQRDAGASAHADARGNRGDRVSGSAGTAGDADLVGANVAANLLRKLDDAAAWRIEGQAVSAAARSINPRYVIDALNGAGYAVNEDKYRIDGEKIHAGRRSFRAADFCTKEMGLRWPETQKVLRDAIERHNARAPETERLQIQPDAMKALLDRYKPFRDARQAERKALLAQGEARIRETFAGERKAVTEAYNVRRADIKEDLPKRDRRQARTIARLGIVNQRQDIAARQQAALAQLRRQVGGEKGEDWKTFLRAAAAHNDLALRLLRKESPLDVEAPDFGRMNADRETQPINIETLADRLAQAQARGAGRYSHQVADNGDVKIIEDTKTGACHVLTDAHHAVVLVRSMDELAADDATTRTIQLQLDLALSRFHGRPLNMGGEAAFVEAVITEAAKRQIKMGRAIEFERPEHRAMMAIAVERETLAEQARQAKRQSRTPAQETSRKPGSVEPVQEPVKAPTPPAPAPEPTKPPAPELAKTPDHGPSL